MISGASHHCEVIQRPNECAHEENEQHPDLEAQHGDQGRSGNADGGDVDRGEVRHEQTCAVPSNLVKPCEGNVQRKPDGKVTKEGIRELFERLDKEQTAKAERRNIEPNHNQSKNDVSEIYSPLE